MYKKTELHEFLSGNNMQPEYIMFKIDLRKVWTTSKFKAKHNESNAEPDFSYDFVLYQTSEIPTFIWWLKPQPDYLHVASFVQCPHFPL